jgi:hypothetical protein
MFGLHFRNFFLNNRVVDDRHACFKVIPHKVPVVDKDRLGSDFSK